MKKIASLFERNYEGEGRLVYNKVVPGAEWVTNGEGKATIKFDGTCCLIRNGQFYKRYDRKLLKSKYKLLKNDSSYVPKIQDYKSAPQGWEAAEEKPNHHTGHWPGWVPVGFGAEDKWHQEAILPVSMLMGFTIDNGTYELVGPKIQANPYGLKKHELWKHGSEFANDPPRTFDELKEWFIDQEIEGIVWHHEDGRMVKIKRRDFGLEWPIKKTKLDLTSDESKVK